MAPMNSLNQNGGQVEYIGIAKGLWPLFLVGFGIALVSGAAHVKRSYLQRSKLQLALNIILSSVVSSAVALGFSLLAPLAYPNITPGRYRPDRQWYRSQTLRCLYAQKAWATCR